MTGRARTALRVVTGGAGAVAVAAALLAGTGGAPSAHRAAVSPAAATESPASGSPASGSAASEGAAADGSAVETASATGHGSWTLQDLAEKYAQLPADLRADLAALRTVPAAGRLAAIEQIRNDALAGAYGQQVRAGAQQLVAGLALLPPALVADLEALVSLEVADMPDAVERLRDRALAGEYGEQVRAGAERLAAMAQEHGVDVHGDLGPYLSAGD